MKKVTIIFALVLVLLLGLIASSFADVYHLPIDFTVGHSEWTSDVEPWSPKFNIPKGKLYIKTYAKYKNQGGDVEYFAVALDRSLPTSSYVKVGASIKTLSINAAVYKNKTYGAFVQKRDGYTGNKIEGRIYINSKNNS